MYVRYNKCFEQKNTASFIERKIEKKHTVSSKYLIISIILN